jgi:RNA polymerase sigma factor (sigma-70 family)
VWDSEALSAAGAEGRRERFERFARHQVDRTYRLAAVMLGDRSEAEDATHDALLRAWEHWPDLRDEDRFEAWFGRILVNECRNRLRRLRRSPIRAIVSVERTQESAPFDAIADRDLLRAALATLTPDHRVALVLRFYLDLDIEEIARRTDARAGTVKSRLHHGLRALAAAYAAGNRTPEGRP